MPEVRFDPIGRRQVVLAPERARRGAPPVEATEPDAEPCDFCGGREDRTPPESYAVRDGSAPDTPGWRVRVVPNLYPATAFHEVAVHTPDHTVEFEHLDRAHRTDVLAAYRERLRAAPTPASVVVWNRGRAAGASRTHAHGQVFGLERVPPTLERESMGLGGDACALCAAATDSQLHVRAIEGIRVMAHPVPFVAGELLVVPPCTPSLEEADDDLLGSASEAFAAAIEATLGSLGPGAAFNLVVHTAPRGFDTFHWHAHLMPRTAVWGGLEMGAELPIVAADPYETARSLRGD